MSFRSHTPPTGRGLPDGMPRAARRPSVGLLFLAVAALLWFSPLALVAWLTAQWLIARQTRWHWHRFTLGALATIGLVLLVLGPLPALRLHFYVPSHFWEYVALMLGFGPGGEPLSPLWLLRATIVTQVWLSVPIGTLAASLTIWRAERTAAGAEWNPFERRRRAVDQRAQDRRIARLLANPREDRLEVPALGVALDGDLPSWVRGDYVVMPSHLRGKAMAVVGAPGAGKTVTLLRLAYAAGVLGRKVAFADCKGTDPTLVPQLIAAYQLGNPLARVGLWPDTPMDMWRGSPSQIVSRLLAVEEFSEPWYERIASTGLRLALTAPGVPRVVASEELLRRLDAGELAELWQAHPLQRNDVRAIAEHLPGARLRYADFFAALGGAFDRGTWSFEDVDLAILTVPTLLSKAEADAAMRVVLEDYGHYATGRKPRQGEDALLILDEFSALASGVDAAISLAERVRDVGVQVVVASQSVEGLGDDRQASRLLAACAGGVIVHQCSDPDRLLRLAGMVREVGQMWDLDRHGPRGSSKIRMEDRPRIDPDDVRAAVPGEAWIIQAGRAAHLRVLPPPAVPHAPILAPLASLETAKVPPFRPSTDRSATRADDDTATTAELVLAPFEVRERARPQEQPDDPPASRVIEWLPPQPGRSGPDDTPSSPGEG